MLFTMLVCVSAWGAEPGVTSSVDIFWKSTRAIPVPGITSVIILDEDIAHAQIGNDTIEFAGLSRGNTVALAFVNGNPVSIVVNVIERPVAVVPPSLLRREAEMAHGTYSSDFQLSDGGGNSNFVLVNGLGWSQQMGDARFDMSSQVEDNTNFGGHEVNLRTASLSYRTPHMSLNAIDFSAGLTGMSAEDHINNFSNSGAVGLRGVGVTLDHGQNEYSFFAGSTIPYYFLSLNSTRDVAGFTFHRKQTDRLSLFGGMSYVNIPLALDTGLIQRRNNVMQTVGASYKLAKNLLIGAQGGYSNAGGLFRADASYASFRFSGYGSAIFASQTFPLNQIASLFSGTSSIRGGMSYRITSRLSQALYAEHSTVTPGLVYRFSGSTDNLSPSFAYHISNSENLNFTYTYSRNQGGFSPAASTGNRYDVSVSSQLTSRINNTAQVTVGSLQDPLQINSEDQFSIRDSVSVPIKGQTINFGIEHDRTQPSLLSKLNGELSLLSPQLQTEFLANPQAFVDSSNFPPEIKALLAAEQPAGTTLSASGSIAIGSKLRISPNVSVTHSSDGNSADSWSDSFGYSASYQLRPTLQFRSSLTNVLLFNSQTNSTQRTMILSAGFQKNFTAVPGQLPLLHRSRTIQGRVFRDNNINGTFNAGEPGLEGIAVDLDDGQIAVTDEQGRYRFTSVSADQHTVTVNLTQFHEPVRMTTRNEVPVDLIQQHMAYADFGILDFARVMGNVFNDLRFDNHRQPDSKGLQGIELVLDNGKNVRHIETSASGDFEIDNVPPGNYTLSIDSNSVPANYTPATDSISVHVSPIASVVQEIPVRALRSISGRLLLKAEKSSQQTAQGDAKSPAKQAALSEKKPAEKDPGQGNNQGFVFIPLADVQIKAMDTIVKTDRDGSFLIRNLPAGKVAVSLVPIKPVPDGLKLPAGEVNLPADPIQVQGATIVISNTELVPYLTTEPLPGEPVAPGNSAPILQGKAAPAVSSKPVPKTAAVSAPAVPETKLAASDTKSIATVVSAAPVAMVRAISISDLPRSVLSSRLALTPSVAPKAPAAAQIASLVEVTARIDCASLPSLGETARCYAQLRRR